MKLNPIVLEKTNKALSANGGLVFLNQLIEQLDLETKLSNFLPVKKKERGITSFTKFKSGIMSFASGSDCIDDLNELREEALYKELCFGGISSRAMGDFLRSFSSMSLENLGNELSDIVNLRMRTHPDELDFILAMDSTSEHLAGIKDIIKPKIDTLCDVIDVSSIATKNNSRPIHARTENQFESVV